MTLIEPGRQKNGQRKSKTDDETTDILACQVKRHNTISRSRLAVQKKDLVYKNGTFFQLTFQVSKF